MRTTYQLLLALQIGVSALLVLSLLNGVAAATGLIGGPRNTPKEWSMGIMLLMVFAGVGLWAWYHGRHERHTAALLILGLFWTIVLCVVFFAAANARWN